MLESKLKFLLKLLLFLLPWQTIWIYREVFVMGTKYQYATLGFYATEILLWILIVLFIIWYLKKSKLQITNYKLLITKDRLFIFSLLLLVLYTLLSSIWSINSAIAYQHGLHIIETILFSIILFAGPLRFKDCAYWFVSGGFFQALLGFWQFVNQRTFGFKLLGLVKHPVYEAGTSIVNAGDFGRWIRAYGAFSHPNVLGGYLIISLILTILLLSTSKNKRLITMFRVFILFDAVGIFLTFSKSAWLSLLLTLFVVYIFATSGDHKKILKAITPIAVIGLLLLVLYRPLVATRVFQKTSNEIESTTDRMQGYSESLDIIQNNALLGVGISNYTFAVRNIDKNRNIWEYQPVHNVPLLILAEIGIIGLLLLFGVFLFYIKFFGKNTSVNTLFWLFPLTPFLLFDHFFWSSYIGILLFGAFVALVAKFLTQKT